MLNQTLESRQTGPHLRQAVAFVNGQRKGSGIVLEKQIVLLKIVSETVFRQRAVSQLPDEGMMEIPSPIGQRTAPLNNGCLSLSSARE